MTMANDASEPAQTIAIKKALEEVGTAANEFYKLSARQPEENDPAVGGGELTVANTVLFAKTMNLLRAVRGPVDMLLAHFQNAAQLGATRALLEMGVFEAIPTGGQSITATELAARTGADKELIVRLMRNATQGYGPFAEVGVETYAHTPFSEIYLVPQMKATFRFQSDEVVPGLHKLHEFFRKENFQLRLSQTHNSLTHAHNMPEGETMWDHIGKTPQRSRDFNNTMAAQGHASPLGAYPFEAELGKYVENEDTVVLVDIGGGKGQAARAIRKSSPGLKGRMIVQDRPQVLSEIEDLVGIETMAHDFFTPQPIKGAVAYYMRRCLHDWDDEDAIKILQQTGTAMTETRDRSRLLIAEMVVPAQKADALTACYDLVMLCIGGLQRTEKQWADLLDRAGFRLTKVWSAPGSDTAVVEAWLK